MSACFIFCLNALTPGNIVTFPLAKGYVSRADWWTSDNLTGSSRCFSSFLLTLDDLHSSNENKWCTIFAQKFFLEQLWSHMSLTSPVKYGPDGRSGVAHGGVTEGEMAALDESGGCEEGRDVDKVVGS